VSSTGRPGASDAQRPPHVLMAAVAGCVEAVLLMMAALLYFTYSAIGPWLAVFGAVFLGLAVACVVGSVLALRGRTPRVLLVAAATAAAIAVVLIAISVAGGGSFDAFSAAVVLLGVGPVVLLLQAPSREWFTASRSR
jgi:hypothetical protein